MTRNSNDQLLDGASYSITTERPPPYRIAVSPGEAARMLGIGRTFLYKSIADGSLSSTKIGGRRLISLKSIESWLAAPQTRGLK